MLLFRTLHIKRAYWIIPILLSSGLFAIQGIFDTGKRVAIDVSNEARLAVMPDGWAGRHFGGLGIQRPRMTVLAAWYGDGDRTDGRDRIMWVTDKVKAQHDRDGFISVPAKMNDHFGSDPAPNVVKKLAIAASFNGQEFHLRGKEGEAFTFTVEDARAKVGITVLAAWYGDGDHKDPKQDRIIWVTDKIKDQCYTDKDGSISVPAKMNDHFGSDPAPNVVKKLAIAVSYKGQEIHLRGKEGEPFKFTINDAKAKLDKKTEPTAPSKAALATKSIWALNKKNEVLFREGITENTPEGTTWKTIDGKLKNIAVSEDGNVWGIDVDGKVSFREGITKVSPAGTKWSTIDGTFSRIIAGAKILGVKDKAEAAYERVGVTEKNPKGSSWKQTKQDFKHISIASDTSTKATKDSSTAKTDVKKASKPSAKKPAAKIAKKPAVKPASSAAKKAPSSKKTPSTKAKKTSAEKAAKKTPSAKKKKAPTGKTSLKAKGKSTANKTPATKKTPAAKGKKASAKKTSIKTPAYKKEKTKKLVKPLPKVTKMQKKKETTTPSKATTKPAPATTAVGGSTAATPATGAATPVEATTGSATAATTTTIGAASTSTTSATAAKDAEATGQTSSTGAAATAAPQATTTGTASTTASTTPTPTGAASTTPSVTPTIKVATNEELSSRTTTFETKKKTLRKGPIRASTFDDDFQPDVTNNKKYVAPVAEDKKSDAKDTKTSDAKPEDKKSDVKNVETKDEKKGAGQAAA